MNYSKNEIYQLLKIEELESHPVDPQDVLKVLQFICIDSTCLCGTYTIQRHVDSRCVIQYQLQDIIITVNLAENKYYGLWTNILTSSNEDIIMNSVSELINFLSVLEKIINSFDNRDQVLKWLRDYSKLADVLKVQAPQRENSLLITFVKASIFQPFNTEEEEQTFTKYIAQIITQL